MEGGSCGMLETSAGGHLATITSIQIQSLISRPDFAILLRPVYLTKNKEGVGERGLAPIAKEYGDMVKHGTISPLFIFTAEDYTRMD